MNNPDKRGFFGEFGGKFAPETLRSVIDELETEYKKARKEKRDAAYANVPKP